MSRRELSFCIIIPCYGEHSKKLHNTISHLKPSKLDIIVIDDGSPFEASRIIEDVCTDLEVKLVKNLTNLGKGGAVKTGLNKARELGFTHAIQIDSDGQHDHSFLDQFIVASRNNPEALVSGKPIFDDSVPRARLYGRYFTHMWVWLETLSFDVQDTMCGFRSYPVDETCEFLSRNHVGNHMDFDIEIMVKLYWSGLKIIFIPLKVLYPEEGKSYFYMFKDNYRITWMHTRLVFGMILRSPKLIARNLSGDSWENISEKGSVFSMKLASKLLDIFGLGFARLLCYPITFYYLLLSQNARQSSRQFQRILREYCRVHNLPLVKFTTFSHILSFAHMVVDKFAVWKRKITPKDFLQSDIDELIRLYDENEGALFLSSHFGNIEVIRGLGKRVSNIKYHSLIYTKNSKKLFSVLKSFDANVEENIVPVQKVGPELGMRLEEKMNAGEWIFCMGDRKTAQSDKVLDMTLLDHKVELPQGPFVLAYVLNCPRIFSIHCFKEDNLFRIKTKEITPTVERTRSNRSKYIESIANDYLRDLEQYLITAPTQWFNFYNYWK